MDYDKIRRVEIRSLLYTALGLAAFHSPNHGLYPGSCKISRRFYASARFFQFLSSGLKSKTSAPLKFFYLPHLGQPICAETKMLIRCCSNECWESKKHPHEEEQAVTNNKSKKNSRNFCTLKKKVRVSGGEYGTHGKDSDRNQK